MRGKPASSNEKTIIWNVFNYMGTNYPLESQRALINRTVEATGSSNLRSNESLKEIKLENFKVLERRGRTGRNSTN